MVSKKSSPFEVIESHFRLLDELIPSTEKIIQSEEDKGVYETSLMYVFRKYQAAKYHFENVKRLLEYDRTIQEALVKQAQEVSDVSGAKIQMQVSWSADYYVYELSAFLEALKSAVDFMAAVISKYLSGIETDSIRTFIRLAEQGRKGPICNVISEKLHWLVKLRDYRHHMVHRMIISARSSHEMRMLEGKPVIINYPVIIPETTPSFVLDTRARRMSEYDAHGFDFIETERRTIKDDGSEEIENTIEVVPPQGYIAIEDFMSFHLVQFEDFFVRMLETLNSLNFEKVVSAG